MLCTPMDDFQLDLVPAKTDPLRSLVDDTFRSVMVPSRSFRLCPSPCDVQGLEVHVRALLAQPIRLGHHAEQGGRLPAGDVYQDVPARPHQVEALAVHVLQVGVANGSNRT